MILSVSRRTDIPAFFSRWFINRLKDGHVLVRNPINPKMVSRIELNRETLDGIVFWTKNPAPMLNDLNLPGDIPYYFLFTVTPYDSDLEPCLPSKKKIIDTFIRLSEAIGKHRVIWRYDPILLSASIDQTYHYNNFEDMARQLAPFTEHCIISYLDMYKKCEGNLKDHHIKALSLAEMKEITGELSAIAHSFGLNISTCAESHDFSSQGVPAGKCIDEELLRRISGIALAGKKDPHQRKTCLCTESIDIGTYNSCAHYCLYCYANSNAAAVRKLLTTHCPDSPLMLGELRGDEQIVVRRTRSLQTMQPTLFKSHK